MEKQTQDERFEVCTKAVRAGKRTYYFDVKKTRNDDYYLTITESKRKADDGDNAKSFEKHKIFLYKEDFEKFAEGLEEVIAYIKKNCLKDNGSKAGFTDVDFEEL